MVALRFVQGSVVCSLLAFTAFGVSAQAAEPPVVVAVDGTLCDLTRTLAGSAATVRCLIPPGGDPHGYRLKPSDRKALAQSSLVLHNGFNLTPAAKKMSSPGTVVAVGELALPNYKGNDPHVWHSPKTSAAMVTVVANSLAPVLPASERAALSARAAKAKAVFNALDSWGNTQFTALPKPKRVLVTDHKAYSHLTDRYGIEQITMLDSYTTGGVLRPSSLKKITVAVKDSGAKTIFTGSLPASKSLKRISRSTALPIASKPLYAEGVAPGESAVSTATINICTVVKGQGGTCDEVAAAQIAERWTAIQ